MCNLYNYIIKTAGSLESTIRKDYVKLGNKRMQILFA